MSTLLVAAILLGIVTGLCLLLVTIDKRSKQKHMNQLLQRIHTLGAKHQLTFSSQELLKNYVIGLDGVHRKLSVIHAPDATQCDAAVVDLADVKRCSVKKQYGTITGGSLKQQKLDSYLERISLCLELKDEQQPVEILFYQHLENHAGDSLELEQKARRWEAILSKLVHTPVQKTA